MRIFNNIPAGPSTKSRPQCLVCCSLLTAGGVAVACRGCGYPACSAPCAALHAAYPECRVFR